MTNRMIIAALTALAASTAAPAKGPAITSVYTDLNLDRCKQLERSEEGDWSVWRCPGFAGVSIYIESGDGRYDIDAGTRDKDDLWSGPFDDIPARVEWRLRGGKPFALIYRLTIATPERPSTSRLLVEKVGRGSTPGCRTADIPGATPRANDLAREEAEKILTKSAICLSRR
ncbi:MAG: hypothetical protein ABIR25_04515 [Sphingomicrobium sp.]